MTGPETHTHTHIARLAGRQKKCIWKHLYHSAEGKEQRGECGRYHRDTDISPADREKEVIIFLENVSGPHEKRRRVANEDVFVLTCLQAHHSTITPEKNLNTNNLIWKNYIL